MLNPQQQLAAQHKDGPLLILAGAGSGKTRVLTERIVNLITTGACQPYQILAVTFTNKAAKEMRERVERSIGTTARDVWLNTFHAACVKILRRHGENLGLPPHFVIFDASDQLSLLKKVLATLNISDKILSPRSAMDKISRAKDTLIEAKDHPDGDFYNEKIAMTYRAYEQELRKAGAVDFGDLIMLTVKLFRTVPDALAHYQQRFRYIMVDEYQDTNHAQYELVRLLADRHKNICVVGDPDQCLPSGTCVKTSSGVKKIEKIKVGDKIIGASGWGKTCSMPVDKIMKNKFCGDLIKIALQSGKTFLATPNHICFARLDPLPGFYYVYLMWRKDKGFRIGTTSGVRYSKDRALLNGINVRTNQEVADAVWILRASSNYGEIRYYEQFYSIQYGLPTMVFHTRGRRMALNQGWVDRLFTEVDTNKAALRLMKDLHIDPRFPHHRPGAVTRGDFNRKYIWFTMFGDSRAYEQRNWHDHRIQLVTSGAQLRKKAEKKFAVRDGRKGTWRIETSRKDYDEGLALSRSISSLDNLDVVSRARLTANHPFFFMPASHLRPGMKIPTLEKNAVVEDTVESVKKIKYRGLVYDLSVPNLRNFSANGVMVHNSIYAWRGADISNILGFERDFPGATVIKLEQNYRSTKNILAASDAVIANNKSRKPKELWTENDAGSPINIIEALDERGEAKEVVREIKKLQSSGISPKDAAIFYRTNAQSRLFEDELRAEGIPYVIFGGTRFYDRAEIKNAIAYLRLIGNPADNVSLKRVINVPARGIGKTTVEKLEAYATQADTPIMAFIETNLGLTDLNNGVKQRLASFAGLLKQMRGLTSKALPILVSEVLDKTGYPAALKAEKTDESLERLANVDELVSAVSEAYRNDPKITLADFLDQVALISDLDKNTAGQDVLPMMTLHLAKGLEFDNVFIVGLEEGLLPHIRAIDDPNELEEERRLFYVGMTRARKSLFICHANERMVRGSFTYNVPSRFLEEIPGEYVAQDFSPANNVAQDFPASQHSSGGRSANVGRSKDLRYEPNFNQDTSGFDFNQTISLSSSSVNWPLATSHQTLFKTGQRVRHPTFGEGIIRRTEGNAGEQRLLIQFRSGELKRLSASHASLITI